MTTVAKTEQICKLLSNYSKDLEAFEEDTKKAIRELMIEVSQAGSNWHGTDYDNFKEKMDSGCNTILNEIKSIPSLIDRVDKLNKTFEKMFMILGGIKK